MKDLIKDISVIHNKLQKLRSIYNTEISESTLTITTLIILFITVSSQVYQSVVAQEQQHILRSNNTNWPNIHSNVKTDFNANVTLPYIQESAFIHPFAVVIGNCYIGKMVLVAPTAVCRGDEGTPIYVGDYSNMQDGVILHGLETTENGKNIDGSRYLASGEKLMANSSEFSKGFSVFVGSNTSLAHDSMVHGPAWIGNNTFFGMKSIVFNAKVGNNVAIGISSTITNGVSIHAYHPEV